MLDRIRGESEPIVLLSSVPGIGKILADRLHDDLGISTLEDLEAAAFDGRLENLAGMGRKRLAGIRDSLSSRLGRARRRSSEQAPDEPPVSELLDVDREYRSRASAGKIPTIAPRRFNPNREAWLPILHTQRGPRHYTALFSNTARAHALGRTRDWVVLYTDGPRGERQWTVVTESKGDLADRRVVRGREGECGEQLAVGRQPDQNASREESRTATKHHDPTSGPLRSLQAAKPSVTSSRGSYVLD